MNNCIFATAGHIDHGKTALVKILTGIDADRLEEEKKRGITIDLGYAYLKGETTTVHFIDVPGHEKFVRNMLAGAGTVSAVLMIIAADESVKPQTREHYEICRLLGMNRGIIALTKTDLVDGERIITVTEEIKNFLKGGFLENAEIIPVSSKTGDGINRLHDEILHLAEKTYQPVSGDIFRLPVDRSFTIQGFGTVITGSLIQGRLRVGDHVETFPSRKKFSIRGIQVFNSSVDTADQGQRTALNLHKASKTDLKRGDILTNTDYFSDYKEIEARLELLDDYEKTIGRDKHVKFYHLSQERNARLLVLDPVKPKKGSHCSCRIIFEEPVFALPGDRFIIRRLTPVETIGGGMIVFNKSAKRTSKVIAAQAENLERNPKEAVFYLIKESRGRCISLRDLRAQSGINTPDLNSITNELRSEGRIILLTPSFIYAESSAVSELKGGCLSAFERYHVENPSKPGLQAGEIIELINEKIEPLLLDHVLSQLVNEKKIVLDKQYYALPSFKDNFDKRKSDLTTRLEEIIKSSGLTPPSLQEISGLMSLQEGIVNQAAKSLKEKGILIKVAQGFFIHTEHLQDTIAKIKAELGDKNEITLQDFKNLLGISRKYLIPILEFLDEDGVTTRLENGNRAFHKT